MDSSRTSSTQIAVTAMAAIALVAIMAVIAPRAEAAKNKVVIRDARQETSFLSRTPRMDIIRTAVVHHGRAVSARVRMRRKVGPARSWERPSLFINTRGNGRSAAEYLVFGAHIYKLPRRGGPKPIAGARLRAKGRNWVLRFDRADLPAAKRYGWVVMTQRKNGNTADISPPRRYAKSPR